MVQEILELQVSEENFKSATTEFCQQTMSFVDATKCPARKMEHFQDSKAVYDVVVLKQILQRMEKVQEFKDWSGHLRKIMHETERDSAVSTIRCLNVFYSFSCETFAAAVNFLDRILARVKVQRKYISVMAAACFYISAKFNEEAEEVPSASEISYLHGQTWKPSDLKRMEMLVIEKLEWQIWPVTCPSLLKVICDIVRSLPHQSDTAQNLTLDTLLNKFQVCINYSSCAIFTPTTLALALIQHTLTERNIQTLEMNRYLLWLQSLCLVQDSEFYECFNTVSEILDLYTNRPGSHPTCLSVPKPQTRMSLISRPSYYGCTDLPTIDESESSDTDNCHR